VDWLTVLGFVLFFLGLLVSIALHEIGHMVPAKLFGVKVTQYMVGFGSTVWSTRRGETEYGVKALPLGGYVRMIGMLPPHPGDDPARLRRTSTGPFQTLVDDARRGSALEIGPDGADRVFYRKPWWQKLIIMTGGPAMNVVLALLLFGVVFMGFGIAQPTTTVAAVAECVVTVEGRAPGATGEECRPGDPPTPAAAAGIRAGDVILAIDGASTPDWSSVTQQIRANADRTVTIDLDRDGGATSVQATILGAQRPSDPDDPCSDPTTTGFLGVVPQQEVVQAGPGAVIAQVAEFTGLTARAIISVPERMVGVWQASFGGGERDLCSPVGIVGAGRIGGELVGADDVSVSDRAAGFLALLASFNLAIAVFNLIPLLPLDGGHIAGALWEGVKRGFARLTGRPEPAPVDVAKGLPVAYAVASVLIVMSVLLLYADIVNPVRLPG
jgi:membrane-associated protease RseP (regulator of RpoE activity)